MRGWAVMGFLICMMPVFIWWVTTGYRGARRLLSRPVPPVVVDGRPAPEDHEAPLDQILTHDYESSRR